MLNRRVMLAGLIGLGAALSPGAFSHAIPAPQVAVSKKRKKSLFTGLPVPMTAMPVGRKSASITVAHGKRLAAKRRNQQRHKRAVRG